MILLRWTIETFFKAIKSAFKLEKEFQVQSFDALIAHTSIFSQDTS